MISAFDFLKSNASLPFPKSKHRCRGCDSSTFEPSATCNHLASVCRQLTEPSYAVCTMALQWLSACMQKREAIRDDVAWQPCCSCSSKQRLESCLPPQHCLSWLQRGWAPALMHWQVPSWQLEMQQSPFLSHASPRLVHVGAGLSKPAARHLLSWHVESVGTSEPQSGCGISALDVSQLHTDA
jgi:hypothetical protein